jgi:hypothetical protein
VVAWNAPRGAERSGLKSCRGLKTGYKAGALTVAGQRRTFTVFPNILAIAVVECAAQGSQYDMEQVSMTSTFIAGLGHEVKIGGRRQECSVVGERQTRA